MKKFKFREFTNKVRACEWMTEFSKRISPPVSVLGITETNGVITVYYIDYE